MKKIILTVAALTISAICANAQSVFETNYKSVYTISQSISLTSGANIKGESKFPGNAKGDVCFNDKDKKIVLPDITITYNPESIDVTSVSHIWISTGEGKLDSGEEVEFQIIEDFHVKEVNMIIQWPDHSSLRFLAKFKGTEE